MEEVRRLRQEKGWNQNELAFHAGLAPSVISLVETGRREPNAATLRKLAAALGVEIPDLFKRPEAPKAEAPPSPEPEEVPEEERRLSYLRFPKLQIERMRERWEEATKQNTFSYEEWNEAAEVAIEMEEAFAEAIPVTVYATGEEWLSREEWTAVAEVLGNITVLKRTIELAFYAYRSRFGEEGAPVHIKDLSAIQEQRKRATGASRRTHDQARGLA